jgi:hypothetical protein
VIAQDMRDLGCEGRIDEPDAGAIEASVADHRQLGPKRPLRLIGESPLHRPERLQDAELLRHWR